MGECDFWRCGGRLSIRALCLGLLVALLGWTSAARAATVFPPAFIVSDIPVSSDGKSGAAAREAARAGGQRQALQVVLQRLTNPSDWQHLPSPDDKALTNMVLDFQVQKERMSPGHYAATYTFRFDPKRVRTLLQDAGITPSELVSKPVVIVPMFNVGGAFHLWDEPNPWRDAWNAANGKAGLVPWIVPLGDLGDVQAFDIAQAQAPSPAALGSLSQRYDGGDPVIATATVNDGGAQGVTLAISVTRFTQGGKEQGSTTVSGPKADANLFASGVVATRGMLEALWKKGPSIPAASVSANAPAYQVAVPISSLQQWATIRDRIDHVDGVADPQIVMMGHDLVVLTLRMAADPQTMRVAFSQHDLVLTPGPTPDAGATLQLAAPGARPLDTAPALPTMPAALPALTPLPPAGPVSPMIPPDAPPARAIPMTAGAPPAPQGGFLVAPPNAAVAPNAGPVQ